MENARESYINAGLVRSQSAIWIVYSQDGQDYSQVIRLGCGAQWIQLEQVG